MSITPGQLAERIAEACEPLCNPLYNRKDK
jgi:hypothetical protein